MNTDVLVIGGGVIGCACAWRLRQAGLSVTLFERRACGQESSWAGAGILDPGSYARSDPLAELRRASCSRYPSFAEELREQTGIDPELIPCGLLDLITDDNQDAAADRELAAANREPAAANREPAAAGVGPAAAQKTGVGKHPAVERLSPEQVRQLEPAVGGDIRGALLKREVCQVRNPRLMRALRAACLQSGVRLMEHTTVTSIECDGDAPCVRTPDGSHRADWIVLAAGAWSSLLNASVGEVVRVAPVRGQMALLECPAAPIGHIIEHGSSYAVSRRDGRLLIGATVEPDAGFDSRPTAAGVERLLGFVRRFLPPLADCRFVRAWAGLRPGSADGKPYIGPIPGQERLIAATGHYRAGLLLAPITAEIVTELITNGRAAPEWASLAPRQS
jgi:glycine oxidase